MENAAERTAAPVSPVTSAQPGTAVEDVHTLCCRAASDSSPLEAGDWSYTSLNFANTSLAAAPTLRGSNTDEHCSKPR
jgi:hypothetical protein